MDEQVINQQNIKQIIEQYDLLANKDLCIEAHTILQKLLMSESFELEPLQFKVCKIILNSWT